MFERACEGEVWAEGVFGPEGEETRVVFCDLAGGGCWSVSLEVELGWQCDARGWPWRGGGYVGTLWPSPTREMESLCEVKCQAPSGR